MRCLVFGATGYTGRHVVSQLVQRGHTVFAHTRSPSQTFLPGVQVVQCAWSDDAIRTCVQEAAPDVIFLLLGTTQKRMRAEHASYETVDVGLTRMAAQAASTLEQKPRLILLSALGASEKSMSAYSKSRAHMEEAVRASGCPWCLVRASFITGPDRQEYRPLERGAAVVFTGLLRGVSALGGKAFAERYRPRTGAEWAEVLVHAAEEKRSGVVTV